jgi:sn-glycerol 3-phosphate transport system permease protein
MNESGQFTEHRLLPLLLLFPQFAVLVIFFFWPAFRAVYEAFFVSDPFGGSSTFVGLENFAYVLSNASYYRSVLISFTFAAAVTVTAMATAFIMAFLVERTGAFQALAKTLIIWPYAIAPAIAGILWLLLFHPAYGAASHLLARLDWNPLLNGGQAFWLVVLASAWKQVSYNFVFFLAGFQSIPKSLMEAAALDGAGEVRRARQIIIPLLAPTTFFLLVMNVVYAFFETFGAIDAVTSGGPGGSTTTLVYRVYLDGFKSHDIGGSAAQSVILMVLVGALTLLQFRYIEKRVSYQ